MNLRKKLNITLLILYSFGFIAAAFVTYLVMDRMAEKALLREIDIVRGSALAVRGYTAEEIRPLLADQMESQFLPHSVPSFSAQAVFRRFQDKFPDFSYKEAALNPTNPADKAVGWEIDLINSLRDNPRLESITIRRDTPTGRILTIAYPITITNEACLTCHSLPDAAPEPMLDLYGRNNGFAWKLNETVGAQIVSVPQSVATARTWQTMALLLGILASAFLVIGVVMNVLLSRYSAETAPAKPVSTPAPRQTRRKKKRR